MTFNQQAAEFWDKETPRVMGDLRARPSAVEFLGDIKGKRVLDAGCGTGYVSRMLAAKGAEVYACDESEEMLEKARNNPSPLTKKINYLKEDITYCRNFEKDFFDGVILVGVLMYTANLDMIIGETNRILKPEGKLVVSVTHPYLYYESSPARRERPYWLELEENKFSPLTMATNMPVFSQIYKDIDGKKFRAQVIDYPTQDYKKAIIDNGFIIKKMKEISSKKEDFIHPSWGTPEGYPAYLQFLATKETK